ncbi:PH domain-containing protein [Cryptosporidium felis]|nr:PH domain-containing protein [Cryptosporidium felis]
MSAKKGETSFTQASLLAREEKVLQDAEIVITTQRTRIGELRSELERLNAEKVYWSNTHMKEMSDVIQENTKLRLQLDEMQADLNALRHTQDSTDNLITNLTEALGVAESQLLAQENELRSLRSKAGNLPIENNQLREENQRLLVENERLKRQNEDNKKSMDLKGSKGSADNAAIQAVNASLNTHAKLARDLDFRTEELRVNKMCLLQLESDLLEHQLLVEQQRVEIQRLNKAVEALNREKALVPPVVITSRQFDLFSQGENNLQQNVSAKQFAEQVVSEIARSFPKVKRALLSTRHRGAENPPSSDKEARNSDYEDSDDEDLQNDPSLTGFGDMDIVQYRTMEEQRMLISRLLKGLDQLGFTRSDATCYKEKASDYRWFYSSFVSHSVTYSSLNNDSSDAISPPGFFNLFVRVESGNVSIFQNMEEEVPLFSVKPWKCKLEIFEKSRQFVLVRTSTTSDQIEHHILYCQTEDEFNRWYYALCYGGFVESRKIENEMSSNAGNNNKTNLNFGLGTKNAGGNTVITVKIIDPNSKQSPQVTQISVYNNRISFSNGKKPIDTCCSKLMIQTTKSQFVINEVNNKEESANITISPDDLRDFEDLKTALINCKWSEVEREAKVAALKAGKTPNEKTGNKMHRSGAQEKKLSPHSINFSMNNDVETCKSEAGAATEDSCSVRHGVILVQNNQVLLYHDESDKAPFTKVNAEDCSIECDRRKMSILLLKRRNKQVESFYYMFASLEEFNRSWARLREGGIQEIKAEMKPSLRQMCVVCKNKMYFHKSSGENSGASSQPFLTISPDDTNCHIDFERNEIILLHSQSDGSRKRIVLDCANMEEFNRWNIALNFGGFIEGVTKSSMSKYTFDISLFGIVNNNGVEQLKNIDTKESKPIYKEFYNITDYQSIDIFMTHEAYLKNTPLLSIPFKDTEYIGDAKRRQIVFSTRRGKAGEVRIIFNLQTLSNFDLMNNDLVNVDFPLLETNTATSLKAEYIVGAKYGLICVYCTKVSMNKEKSNGNFRQALNDVKYANKVTNHHHDGEKGGGGGGSSSVRKFPECGYIKYSINDFICVASRAGRSVALRRKDDDYDALSVRCKSLTEFEKWERSMTIAGFINGDAMKNNTYLPPITYLFHSLDYDYRKQPVLPSLNKFKSGNESKATEGGGLSAAVTNSDHSLSHDENASISGLNDENRSRRNAGSGGRNLMLPPKGLSGKGSGKLLDSSPVHGRSAAMLLNMRGLPLEKEDEERGLELDGDVVGCGGNGHFRLEDFNEGLEVDDWEDVSEIVREGVVGTTGVRSALGFVGEIEEEATSVDDSLDESGNGDGDDDGDDDDDDGDDAGRIIFGRNGGEEEEEEDTVVDHFERVFFDMGDDDEEDDDHYHHHDDSMEKKLGGDGCEEIMISIGPGGGACYDGAKGSPKQRRVSELEHQEYKVSGNDYLGCKFGDGRTLSNDRIRLKSGERTRKAVRGDEDGWRPLQFGLDGLRGGEEGEKRRGRWREREAEGEEHAEEDEDEEGEYEEYTEEEEDGEREDSLGEDERQCVRARRGSRGPGEERGGTEREEPRRLGDGSGVGRVLGAGTTQDENKSDNRLGPDLDFSLLSELREVQVGSEAERGEPSVPSRWKRNKESIRAIIGRMRLRRT